MGELNKKKKHNHTLTDLLKVSIFSAVMLAPFMAIGVRCGYVMWNKNAKDSYSGTMAYQEYNPLFNTNEIDNTDNTSTLNSLHENYIYELCINYTWGATSQSFNLYNEVSYNKKIELYAYVDNADNYVLYHGDQIYSGYQLSGNVGGTSNNIIQLQSTNDRGFRIQSNSGTSTGVYKFYIVLLQLTNLNINNDLYTFNACPQNYMPYSVIEHNIDTLDNAFSYSVNQISNDPVFNWTRNTGIYQPINAMVEGLEIENDTLQILLAYWSLITAVYIVFDIIIFCFTKLTHFINE